MRERSWSFFSTSLSMSDFLAAKINFSHALVGLNLFERAPDQAGLDFRVAQLIGGKPPGRFILDVISGATGNDKLVLDRHADDGRVQQHQGQQYQALHGAGHRRKRHAVDFLRDESVHVFQRAAGRSAQQRVQLDRPEPRQPAHCKVVPARAQSGTPGARCGRTPARSLLSCI